jgi:hypothetical protein
MMSERDFQHEVLTKLGDLHAAQGETAANLGAVVQRLDRLNGSVARHEGSINDLKLDQAHKAGAKELSNSILTAAKPAVWTVLGIVVMWVLQHGQQLLELLK